MGERSTTTAKNAGRRGSVGRIVNIALFMLAGMVSGVVIMRCLRAAVPDGAPRGYRSLLFAFLVVGMYAAFLLQTIIHEAGHLVFGLLSGYSFLSFRIGSFAWVKSDGRVRFARQSIAGTGGQCLMSPPDLNDGSFPVILYNLGGVLMNLISSAIFLVLSILCAPWPIASTLLALPAVVGVFMAAINGIPLSIGDVDNDGKNAVALAHNATARRAFWVQLKVSGLTACGVRVKDMPEEWFVLPPDGEMANSMAASIGPFAATRLMDEHRFAEADELMGHLLTIENGMAGLYRQLLVNDRLFVELIGENRPDAVAGMRTDEQEQFMTAMRDYPSVLRTEYAYALLHERDAEKAAQVAQRFDKMALGHPYPSDIVSERELMAIADEAAARTEDEA